MSTQRPDLRIGGILVLAVCFTGCNTYMTKDLRSSLRSADLPKVQYSLSQQLVLSRTIGSDERDVTPGHQVRIVKGQRVEEVIFPKGCPGIAPDAPALPGTEIGKNLLLVSFESGSTEFPNPTLTFEPVRQTRCSWVPRSILLRILLAPGVMVCNGLLESDAFGLVGRGNNAFSIKYMGKDFNVDGSPVLIIASQEVKESIRDTRIVPGRKVGE